MSGDHPRRGDADDSEPDRPASHEVAVGGAGFSSALGLDVQDVAPSDVNGPGTAHTAAAFHIEKPDWNKGTTSVGEIDGVVIETRQGGPGSDTSGLLINTAGTGEGFINGLEMAVSRVCPDSDTTTDFVNQQIGIINHGGNLIYGYHTYLNLKDSRKTAIAYNIDGKASWDVYFQAPNYKVDGSGSITTAGNLTVAQTVYLGAEQGMWIRQDKGRIVIGAGATELVSIDSAGNVTAAGTFTTKSSA